METLRRALLDWFDLARRDLPWRRTKDPYLVYLSEIMLQQTRVETVIPYFARFVAAFPSVKHLAEAPLDDVLELWSGLGYYRRARTMHVAAREVVERYGGAFPASRAGLESLPGIGAYTAGAISSIAFGLEEPLVDGNVARVLSRIFAIDDALGSRASNEKLWTLARALVVGERPGDLNQALMELGATVCKPGEPDCARCPAAARCEARRTGRTRELPVAKARRAPKRVDLVAVVARDAKGRVLLAKRAADGLFGGLWEPPMLDPGAPELARIGETIELGRSEHVLTHRILSVTVVAPKTLPRSLVPAGYVESRFHEEGAALGISSLARKVLRLGASIPTKAKPARAKKPAPPGR